MKKVLLFFLLTGMLFLAGCSLLTPAFKGTLLPNPVPVSDFTLLGADGQPVNLSDFQDKNVLLYFGYTFCPDVCPTTMADLAKAQREIDDSGEDFQVIMVTVDPERDTTEKMGAYVEHFHPTFVGLTGTKEAIDKAGEDYGLYYEIHAGTAASGYLVDHTARVYVIDRDGMYTLSWAYGTPWEDIAADMKILR